MRITYYALKPLKIGEEVREPGDLVPEAGNWNFLSGYINEGQLAPVLVATLPEEQQIMLLDWEAEQNAPVVADEDVVDEAVEDVEDTDKAEDPKPEQVKDESPKGEKGKVA